MALYNLNRIEDTMGTLYADDVFSDLKDFYLSTSVEQAQMELLDLDILFLKGIKVCQYLKTVIAEHPMQLQELMDVSQKLMQASKFTMYAEEKAKEIRKEHIKTTLRNIEIKPGTYIKKALFSTPPIATSPAPPVRRSNGGRVSRPSPYTRSSSSADERRRTLLSSSSTHRCNLGDELSDGEEVVDDF